MFEIGGGTSIPPIKHGQPTALGLLWLKDVVDNEDVDLDIPVVVGERLSRLRQNCLTDFAAQTHAYKVVGHFKLRMRLDSGLDEVCHRVILLCNKQLKSFIQDHEKYAATQSRRHAYET